MQHIKEWDLCWQAASTSRTNQYHKPRSFFPSKREQALLLREVREEKTSPWTEAESASAWWWQGVTFTVAATSIFWVLFFFILTKHFVTLKAVWLNLFMVYLKKWLKSLPHKATEIRLSSILTWEGKGRRAVSTGASIFFAAERGWRAGFGRWRAAGERTGFTVWEGAKRRDRNCDTWQHILDSIRIVLKN